MPTLLPTLPIRLHLCLQSVYFSAGIFRTFSEISQRCKHFTSDPNFNLQNDKTLLPLHKGTIWDKSQRWWSVGAVRLKVPPSSSISTTSLITWAPAQSLSKKRKNLHSGSAVKSLQLYSNKTQQQSEITFCSIKTPRSWKIEEPAPHRAPAENKLLLLLMEQFLDRRSDGGVSFSSTQRGDASWELTEEKLQI